MTGNNDIAFCSVAFGSRYIEQIDRLFHSIFDVYGSSPIFFYKNEWPTKSRSHEDSLYGFKVYAIAEARSRGFKRIIWVDPACILQQPVDYYFNEPGMPAVTVVKDDNLLINFISDKAMSYYGHPDIEGQHLVGGSLYVFDFSRPQASLVFDSWAKAERDGMFGTAKEAASEQINKHRSDESCMAISLMMAGVPSVGHDVARYCNGAGSIWDKKHFR